MIFIETSVFTRRISEFLSDDEYRLFQKELMGNPTKGALIPNSGGLRKLRWTVQERGKRGGLRMIYYWATPENKIYMLYIYSKTEQDNLSSKQLKALKRIIEE